MIFKLEGKCSGTSFVNVTGADHSLNKLISTGTLSPYAALTRTT